MAPKRIVAVAVAKENNKITIRSRRDLKDLRRLKVRPYLRGLVQELEKRGKKLRKDYVIEFQQRKRNAMNNVAAFGNPIPGDVIFCMSTTVVKAASDLFPANAVPPIPIVGIVSDPALENNAAGTAFSQIANVCGVSAKRVSSAGECLDRFVRAVPTLEEVKVLATTAGVYGPSDRALAAVQQKAKDIGIPCPTIFFADIDALETALGQLTERDPEEQAATSGVLVLPIDLCLGHAQDIIDLVQGEKKLPVFFPVPDWVSSNASGAFGGYGVPQKTCGELMAERVSVIWRNANTIPANLQRWIDAPNEAFVFLVSGAVADAQELNIDLPAGIPRI